MATSLDMSLDEIIKSKNSERRGRARARRGRGRGLASGPLNGGRMAGAPRRGPLRVNTQSSPYTIAKSFRRTKNISWQHDLFEDSLRASGLPGMETGAKLFVSNLDYGVTNEDIRELFADIGELKRYAVHYDKNGRSSGSADVVYARRSDAFAAMKRYNNVQLDGKPMKIEIIGVNSDLPVSARVNVIGAVNGRKRRTLVMPGLGRGGGGSAPINRGSGSRNRGGMTNARGLIRGGQGRGRARGRGFGRGGGGGGGGGRGKKPVEKSAADLDKELEKYHTEAMQT